MHKYRKTRDILAAAAALTAFATLADIELVVDTAERLGPIKPMNAVNNGPVKARSSDQSRGNFAAYKALRIPFARTHDSIQQATSNGHTVDISAVFPDFDADENDPKNYDFTYTDEFLKCIRAAGTEPFFRLGQTIENGVKKYHVYPPKDFAKWARICEHVILHFNEGWADGFRWNIRYWEVWNEADAQLDEDRAKSCQWQGTKQEFFSFFETVLKHLKGRFPKLRIGGPSLGWREDWGQEFIAYLHKTETPIDFFSWHVYSGGVLTMKKNSVLYRRCLDTNGFEKAESVLNEWNYIKNWTTDYPYSCQVMSSHKGGAFVAAAMSACQDKPVDLLMYYDARPATVYNGLFDFYTYGPRPAYFAFTAWADLKDLGMQVATKVIEGSAGRDLVESTAAVGPDGTVGVLLSRFCNSDDVTAPEATTIRFAKGRFVGRIRAYLTDADHLGSDYPLFPEKDGSLKFHLKPNAFVFLVNKPEMQ